MIWPLIPFSYDTINYDLSGSAPSPPSSVNWLGTDDQGRDELARLIYGLRNSVLIGLTLTANSSVIGDADGAVQELISAKGWMIWPLVPFSYGTINYNLPSPAPSPPSSANWLGTDDQGRDVLARLIYGLRISVLFGLTLTALSSVIGVAAGAVQGYFGGLVDLGFQRILEIWSGLPILYLLIIMASLIEPNFWWLLGLMLLFSWTALVDVVRAEFLRARNFDYVRAARALGVSNPLIILRHVLPNATVATVTFMPFILNGSITTLTSLDFLGFGLPPGSPSLGELLAQGKANLQAPWLGLTACFVLASILSLLICVGEAVRDAIDPRKVVL
jgi:microcin C transport system permease protein